MWVSSGFSIHLCKMLYNHVLELEKVSIGYIIYKYQKSNGVGLGLVLLKLILFVLPTLLHKGLEFLLRHFSITIAVIFVKYSVNLKIKKYCCRVIKGFQNTATSITIFEESNLTHILSTFQVRNGQITTIKYVCGVHWEYIWNTRIFKDM